jgi:Sec7-like guanine-nucleotide exchange factor
LGTDLHVLHRANHLEDYLISLSVQNRATKRAGFPPEVLTEIYNIEEANAPFLTKMPEKPSWNDVFR